MVLVTLAHPMINLGACCSLVALVLVALAHPMIHFEHDGPRLSTSSLAVHYPDPDQDLDPDPEPGPDSQQDDRFSGLHGARKGGVSVKMFSPEQLPVKTALAREYGVFNRLFTAVPSASSPNHLFVQSATSCGMTGNVLYDDCGGGKVTFPQKTIFDSMREAGASFGFYLNSTCGLDGEPCHGEDPHDPDSASAIATPDVAMEGVGRYKEEFFSQDSVC